MTMRHLDPERLGELFSAHAAVLVLFARARVERSEAEDLVQEAFVRLMTAKPEPTDPRAWLYTVVRRLALDRGRRKRRQVRSDADPCFSPGRPGDEEARRVEQMLRSLPGEEREVLILRVWGGLTLEQVGRVLGLSTATTHRRYREALAQAGRSMEDACRTT